MIRQIPRPAAVPYMENEARLTHFLRTHGHPDARCAWWTGDRTVLVVESAADPATALNGYSSAPPPEEVARGALRAALSEIRAIPAERRTPEQRAWLAWAVLHWPGA